MKTLWRKTCTAVAGTWSAVLGIAYELALTGVIIGGCFVICLFWWGIVR